MLVLSRTRGQEIVIELPDGELITIMAVDIRHSRKGKVRLGITAASNITVHRREVYDAIQEKKQQNAAQAG